MKLKSKGKSLVVTFVTYSCLIFIIPTVILLSKIYFSDIVNLEDEIANTSINHVRYLNNSIEKRLSNLDTIALKISQEHKISKYYMSRGLTAEMDGISEIAKYKEINGFVDDIIVYFRNDDYIYSSEGRSSFDAMFNLVYQYPANMRYDIINNLNNLEKPLMMPSEEVLVKGIDKQNIITYIYPIKNEYEKLNMAVLFVISDKSIINEIKLNYNNKLGEVFILDSKNHVIASTGSQLVNVSELTPNFFINLQNNGISTAAHNKEKYILTSSNINNTNLKLTLVAKKSVLFSEVTSSRISLSLLIFSLLVLGVILILFVVKRSYKSILVIKNKMDLYSTNTIKSGSEIDQIISWMDDVIEQKEKIEGEFQNRHRLVQNQILEMLIKGQINNTGNVNSLVDQNEFDFIKAFFSVVVITPVDSNKKLNVDWSFFELYNSFNQMGMYYLELESDNAVAIIATGNTEDEVKDAEQNAIDSILSIFSPNFMKIGIGNIYSDLAYLNNSFFEARISLDNILNKNTNLLRYEDIIFNNEGGAYWNLNEERAKFIQCIKYGNLEGAKINLDIMLDTINASETSYIYRNLAYLDIINMLIRVCKSNNIPIDQETIAELSNISNFDQIQDKLENVLEKSFEQRRINQEEQNSELFNNILTYINENYCNSDISLENVADHFGVTTHFLSRYIKENLNISFTDLLVKLRMDHFKRLVVETDHPIKDLIAAVGYIDTSSFVRKFKKMEGITPGAYRQMLKNG